MSGTREIARDDSADDPVVAASARTTTPVAVATPRTRRRMASAVAPVAPPCPDVTGAGPPRTMLEARSRIASSHGLDVQPRAIGLTLAPYGSPFRTPRLRGVLQWTG